ncbi:MAG: YggS family pyridoxal phosphate-dependent enzyme [Eubacteriales bacterium]
MKEKSLNSEQNETLSAENAPAADERSYEERVETAVRGMTDVRGRIKAAAGERAIRLCAATKTVPAEVINYAIDNLGLTEIGENRVQELLDKYEALHRDKIKLHFIGSLQTNKVKYIVGKVDLIHSLDSVGLAQEIEKRSAKLGIISDVLIEINIGGERSKGGVPPEDVLGFYDSVSVFPHVRVCGIMAMAPKCDTNEEYCRYFEKTYRIFIDISGKRLHNIDSPILSMGMSGSFEQAIACGSNMVRIGSAIFGGRVYPTR